MHPPDKDIISPPRSQSRDEKGGGQSCGYQPGTNLKGADLSGHDLSNADLTGATMPDGSIHK